MADLPAMTAEELERYNRLAVAMPENRIHVPARDVLRLLSDLAAARAEVERLSKLVSPMRVISGFRGPWEDGAKRCRYCGNVIWRMSEGQVGEHDEKCPTMIARKALCDAGISSPADILRSAVSDDAARALVASPGAGEGREGE